jgi:hypothetical protein
LGIDTGKVMQRKIVTILLTLVVFASCSNKVYLFTSFHEPANEGLRLLYSKDGYHWKTTDSIYLKPMIGKDKPFTWFGQQNGKVAMDLVMHLQRT